MDNKTKQFHLVSGCCHSGYNKLPYDEEFGKRYVCKKCGEICFVIKVKIIQDKNEGKNKN
jgi:hypothetical protein